MNPAAPPAPAVHVNPAAEALHRSWRRALGWLWLGALAVVLLVQIPGVGNIDTARRLQVARSLWTDEPPVRPEEYPHFGIRAESGIIHAWYGVGQSLLMLPADLVAGWVEPRNTTPENRRKVRSVVVATLTFPLLNACSVALAAHWLLGLGFRPRSALLGAIGLLLGSTFLHYSQVHMENSLQDFLVLLDGVALQTWLRTGRRRWLALAGATVGAGILVRLPSLGEHLVPWGLTLFELGRRIPRPLSLPALIRGLAIGRILAVAAPIALLGLAGDRAYHWHRFGKWTGTYIKEQALEARRQSPTLPESFPFNGNFATGLVGPLFSPYRSMLLHDPLLWVTGMVAAARWRRLLSRWKTLLAIATGSALLLVVFYARCIFWDGAAGWSNRYTLPPVHLLCLAALALWSEFKAGFGAPARAFASFAIGLALFFQVISVAMPSPLEGMQGSLAGERPFPIRLRILNIAQLAAGRPAPPGVDPGLWRWNIAPATLSSAAPRLAIPLWTAWISGLVASVWLIRRSLSTPGIPAIDAPLPRG